MRGKNFKNMSKRKHKKRIQEQSATVIKPDVKVNVEIDYDKLAEAIVKAEKKAQEDENKKIKSVIDLHKRGLRFLFKMFARFGWLIISLFLIAVVTVLTQLNWSDAANIIVNVAFIIAMVFVITFGSYMFTKMGKAAEEVDNIKDKNLLITMTSSIMGFAALIVAIVTIFVR